MFKNIFNSQLNKFWELYEKFLWTNERFISFINETLSKLQLWLFAKLPYASDSFYRDYFALREIGVDYCSLERSSSYTLYELAGMCEEIADHRKEENCSYNVATCTYKPHKNGKGTKVHPDPSHHSNVTITPEELKRRGDQLQLHLEALLKKSK